MATWVIDRQLARGQRPGYSGEHGRPVGRAEVDDWIAGLKAMGIKSIICLLADDQLHLYGDLPADLVSYYRNAGFKAEHVPARDHEYPPLTEEHLEKIWNAYQSLPKPVLVHCSAGVDRTGRAVDYIQKKLKTSMSDPDHG